MCDTSTLTDRKNLKEARNNFVHKGRAEIGDKPVTADVASRLVQTTKDIIRWTEKLIPEEGRWLSDERPFQFSLFCQGIQCFFRTRLLLETSRW